MPTSAARIRLLIAHASADKPASWGDWLALRATSVNARRIALQVVMRPDCDAEAVGVGFGERLRWFSPVDDLHARRLIIDYADQVLQSGWVEVPEPLRALLRGASEPVGAQVGAVGSGIVLLSHAETDLLVLERVKALLPEGFPTVTGCSLLGITRTDELLQRVGTLSADTAVIVRVHGTSHSVPGLQGMRDAANQGGWKLVSISGVDASAESLTRSADVSAAFTERLARYFLEGGPANVAQALRYTAAVLLAVNVSHELPASMPAHGLYHPDLLITTPEEWAAHRDPQQREAWVIFYRAHVLSGNLEFVDRIIRALQARHLNALGVFTSSLRERDGEGVPHALRLLSSPSDIFVSTIGFPVFTLTSLAAPSAATRPSPFELLGRPLLQGICCGTPRAEWRNSKRGLSSSEAAMNVALPECDGRVGGPPVSFKEEHRYVPDRERIERFADLTLRMVELQSIPNAEKRVAVVLNNVGGRAERIGNAVGLDAPASVLRLLAALRDAGYVVGELPPSADALMDRLLARGSYDDAHPLDMGAAWAMPRARYAHWFRAQSPGFRESMVRQWGEPQDHGQTHAPPLWHASKESARPKTLLMLGEPHSTEDCYLYSGLQFGNVLLSVQPPRAYGMDASAMYHALDVPPTHHYTAFYRWLADQWGAHAVVHMGAHGTLEWLPGKSMALSADCAPDVLLGDLPLIYPFVVNNPGEGAQAKRRTHAVIIDHLTPPMVEAGFYGALSSLARLVEEYYRAEVLDVAKLPVLRQQIWELVRTANLEEDLRQLRLERHGDHAHGWDDRLTDAGIPRALDQLSGKGFAHLLEDLDAYLCDLGRAQIRGGLHILGEAPSGAGLIELLRTVTQSPNGPVHALPRALADCIGLDLASLDAATGLWQSPRPSSLKLASTTAVTVAEVRNAVNALCVRLLEDLARHRFDESVIDGALERHLGDAGATGRGSLIEVLRFVCSNLVPNLERTSDEIRNILAALEGRYVAAGPAGSPQRGMAHVLPTGRNFYTVDPRALPTQAAWSVGRAVAEQTIAHYHAEHGTYPEGIALSIWGTPTMRTGGDDFAQALALIGVQPCWEAQSRRTLGIEVIPLQELGRPRIDVTLRVSGFFRDAFASLIHLFDEAVRTVARLDEPAELNFVRKHWLGDTQILEGKVLPDTGTDAATLAGYRVFGSRPGAYGAALMEVLEAGAWNTRGDLADAAVRAGSWVYGRDTAEAFESPELLRRQLARTDLVLHTLDSATEDLFSSSEVFEFQGGLIAAVTAETSRHPSAYIADTSLPEKPAIRTLGLEASRILRARVLNPRWHEAMRAHGYRGAAEMAATVDAIFGFSATADIVTDAMFERIAQTFTTGDNREFLDQYNVWALHAIAERLLEAQQRGLWDASPRALESLQAALLASEEIMESNTEQVQ